MSKLTIRNKCILGMWSLFRGEERQSGTRVEGLQKAAPNSY